MAADVLRFFPEKDPFVTRPGMNATSELPSPWPTGTGSGTGRIT